MDGTRYQQINDAGQFAGPLSITGLTFYNTVRPGGYVSDRTFTIHLSTTSVAVDALSGMMGDNMGTDDALFAIFAGGPGVTGTFTISGAPFDYDPAGGNLLMDTFVSGGTAGWFYLDARSNSGASSAGCTISGRASRGMGWSQDLRPEAPFPNRERRDFWRADFCWLVEAAHLDGSA